MPSGSTSATVEARAWPSVGVPPSRRLVVRFTAVVSVTVTLPVGGEFWITMSSTLITRPAASRVMKRARSTLRSVSVPSSFSSGTIRPLITTGVSTLSVMMTRRPPKASVAPAIV